MNYKHDMQYKTLAELREAYRFPEGQRPGELLIMSGYCAANNTDDVTVFEMGPTELLEQALALLGIPVHHG